MLPQEEKKRLMMIYHYVIVRRDLDVGTIAAMVLHAVGESASWYDTYFGNGKPLWLTGAIAVILEAKSEYDLKKTIDLLDDHNIDYTRIIESEGTYANQLMAIGLAPVVGKLELLNSYQTLKSCKPEETV